MTNEEMIAELNQLLVTVQKAMPPRIFTLCRTPQDIHGILVEYAEVEDLMKCHDVWSQRWKQ